MIKKIKSKDIDYLCNACGEVADDSLTEDLRLLPHDEYSAALCDAYHNLQGEDYSYPNYIGRICGKEYFFFCAEFGEVEELCSHRFGGIKDAVLAKGEKLITALKTLGNIDVFFPEDCESPFCQWLLIVAIPVETKPTKQFAKKVETAMKVCLDHAEIVRPCADVVMENDGKTEILLFTGDDPGDKPVEIRLTVEQAKAVADAYRRQQVTEKAIAFLENKCIDHSLDWTVAEDQEAVAAFVDTYLAGEEDDAYRQSLFVSQFEKMQEAFKECDEIQQYCQRHARPILEKYLKAKIEAGEMDQESYAEDFEDILKDFIYKLDRNTDKDLGRDILDDVYRQWYG